MKITWHPLHLINGWKSASNIELETGTPSYAVSGGVVYLTGAIIRPTGSSPTFAMLPKNARPTHQLWIEAYTSTDIPGTVQIAPNGAADALNGESSFVRHQRRRGLPRRVGAPEHRHG